MANMPYCRFQNTANDLRDCLENWGDLELDEEERIARDRIINLARVIVDREGRY